MTATDLTAKDELAAANEAEEADVDGDEMSLEEHCELIDDWLASGWNGDPRPGESSAKPLHDALSSALDHEDNGAWRAAAEKWEEAKSMATALGFYGVADSAGAFAKNAREAWRAENAILVKPDAARKFSAAIFEAFGPAEDSDRERDMALSALGLANAARAVKGLRTIPEYDNNPQFILREAMRDISLGGDLYVDEEAASRRALLARAVVEDAMIDGDEKPAPVRDAAFASLDEEWDGMDALVKRESMAPETVGGFFYGAAGAIEEVIKEFKEAK